MSHHEHNGFDLGRMSRQAGFHGMKGGEGHVKGKGGATHYPMAGMRATRESKVLMPGCGSIMGTSCGTPHQDKPTFQRRTKEY